MEVLILSKTRVGKRLACVGGVCPSNGQFVRLMRAPHQYQLSDTDFEVGQIWNIAFTAIPDNPPHVEDVVVNSKTLLRTQDQLKDFIQKKGYKIWNGNVETCFDGLLHWTSGGGGYLSKNQCLPSNSVGFWETDRKLVPFQFNN